MNHPILRTPSVGSITKKILAINPDLGLHEVIALVRGAVRQNKPGDVETVDEAEALKRARETVRK